MSRMMWWRTERTVHKCYKHIKSIDTGKGVSEGRPVSVGAGEEPLHDEYHEQLLSKNILSDPGVRVSASDDVWTTTHRGPLATTRYYGRRGLFDAQHMSDCASRDDGSLLVTYWKAAVYFILEAHGLYIH